MRWWIREGSRGGEAARGQVCSPHEEVGVSERGEMRWWGPCQVGGEGEEVKGMVGPMGMRGERKEMGEGCRG